MISPPGAVYMKRGVSKPLAYSSIVKPVRNLQLSTIGLRNHPGTVV